MEGEKGVYYGNIKKKKKALKFMNSDIIVPNYVVLYTTTLKQNFVPMTLTKSFLYDKQ